jgi:hypothetical protein
MSSIRVVSILVPFKASYGRLDVTSIMMITDRMNAVDLDLYPTAI